MKCDAIDVERRGDASELFSRTVANIIAVEDGLMDIEGRRDIVSTKLQLISQLISFI